MGFHLHRLRDCLILPSILPCSDQSVPLCSNLSCKPNSVQHVPRIPLPLLAIFHTLPDRYAPTMAVSRRTVQHLSSSRALPHPLVSNISPRTFRLQTNPPRLDVRRYRQAAAYSVIVDTACHLRFSHWPSQTSVFISTLSGRSLRQYSSVSTDYRSSGGWVIDNHPDSGGQDTETDKEATTDKMPIVHIVLFEFKPTASHTQVEDVCPVLS